MATVPSTSISILKAISGDAASVRWTEFFHRYEQPMRGFLAAKFPSVDPDDAIQETMRALVSALPNYVYTPDGRGHFRNYLMGILRHKAADILRRRLQETSGRENYRRDRRDDLSAAPAVENSDDEAERLFRESALQAALEQVLADEKIAASTREVFRHVALLNERPEAVAAAFGLTRNNVDQIKSRMIARLTRLANEMLRG